MLIKWLQIVNKMCYTSVKDEFLLGDNMNEQYSWTSVMSQNQQYPDETFL